MEFPVSQAHYITLIPIKWISTKEQFGVWEKFWSIMIMIKKFLLLDLAQRLSIQIWAAAKHCTVSQSVVMWTSQKLLDCKNWWDSTNILCKTWNWVDQPISTRFSWRPWKLLPRTRKQDIQYTLFCWYWLMVKSMICNQSRTVSSKLLSCRYQSLLWELEMKTSKIWKSLMETMD